MKNVVFLPLLVVLSISTACVEGPVEVLLKLVPLDAGAVLAAEGLCGTAWTVLTSPLVKHLRDLPAIKAWRNGGGLVKLREARREV